MAGKLADLVLGTIRLRTASLTDWRPGELICRGTAKAGSFCHLDRIDSICLANTGFSFLARYWDVNVVNARSERLDVLFVLCQWLHHVPLA